MMPRKDRVLRMFLLASGPMNLGGAICFAPPFPVFRRLLGIPEADPVYLWVLCTWISAFGVGYLWQAWTCHFNRGVLALGAFGKLTFAASLIAYGIQRPHGAQTIGGALPDLAFAIAFMVWLWVSDERVLVLRSGGARIHDED